MDVQDTLETIVRGRGPDRDLPYPLARRLFEAILDGRLGGIELGAVLVALRLKGESVDEVRAGLDALAPLLSRVPVDASRPVVAIPSYAGALGCASRVPLLACLIAGAGVQVVVHGPTSDPRRTTTAEVMRAMGLGPADGLAHAQAAIDRGDPAFVPVGVLSSRLEALLALRGPLGVRNVGHALAGLLDPTDAAACLRLTCPLPGHGPSCLPQRYFERTGRAALVLAGGDEVDAAGGIDWVHDGRTEALAPADDRMPLAAPTLPEPLDAPATARWIQSVLAGERPLPEAIERQLSAVLHAVGLLPAERAAVPA
jgi:anthranilate phosphoribosyltransferase